MATPRILIVDDEPSIRRTLQEILQYEGYHTAEAATGDEALERLKKEDIHLVLLDIKMPGKSGMEVLDEIQASSPDIPVVMISGHGTIETAVEATRKGAIDFIEKPPDLNRLLVTIRNALKRGKLETENRRIRQVLLEHQELIPILGNSPAIQRIKDTIARVAPTEARVLITGEPGTGKELVARWIHYQSRRSEGPLVEVNCAAIPSELIESELFGHEKGAFTGATRQRVGKFELAHGGTLFLDEVGDMSLNAQAKVLRVLEEQRITRVGGERSIPVDVRIIAATNQPLQQKIEEGTFREDLYHRLSVILIHVPPLRERREDIPLLVEYFVERLSRYHGLPPRPFSPEALELLQRLEWRGNVRELRNVVERLLILSEGDEITGADVHRYVYPPAIKETSLDALLARYEQFSEFRDMAEKLFLEYKLRQYNWNISKTAEAIGIQRSHLYNKMNKYGIERTSG